MADPITGIYNSTDLGGALLTGRNTTSRACINTCGGIGDVFNVTSWNGAALGTQWTAVCGIETTPYTVKDDRVGGTGPVTYTSSFNGGTFNLNPGPWGSGSGTLNTTLVISTVQFVMIGGVSTPVASRANVTSSGMFEGGCTLTFVIANGIGVGETPMIRPAAYPPFIDTSCEPTRIYGTWGDVSQITMSIDCGTPAESQSWGAVKSLYR
ncbi:MAG: hypothetical protein QME66_08095 [Candidatus Eisenbacteria bacterium]|nr:hypothetical protein [Candidatus Eisenbacteria bacterium]